jgi:hypothetical protein
MHLPESAAPGRILFNYTYRHVLGPGLVKSLGSFPRAIASTAPTPSILSLRNDRAGYYHGGLSDMAKTWERNNGGSIFYFYGQSGGFGLGKR